MTVLKRFSLCIVTVACVLTPRAVVAQEMELPVAVQIPLFLKVISFDRLRNGLPDTSLVVGVAYQRGFRTSVNTRDEVDRALRNVPGRHIRVVMVDLDHDDLNEILRQQPVTFLYVAPLRGFRLRDIALAAESARAMTVTGVPQYVEQGLALGARLQRERPRLLVNLAAARRSGTNFASDLLKLAEVLE